MGEVSIGNLGEMQSSANINLACAFDCMEKLACVKGRDCECFIYIIIN